MRGARNIGTIRNAARIFSGGFALLNANAAEVRLLRVSRLKNVFETTASRWQVIAPGLISLTRVARDQSVILSEATGTKSKDLSSYGRLWIPVGTCIERSLAVCAARDDRQCTDSRPRFPYLDVLLTKQRNSVISVHTETTV